MNMTRDRVQSLVWALIISVSFALLLALTFRVNAVKSQVRLLDRRIVALKQEKSLIETEFQTRANQQQLAALNEVDFGFKAPSAAQYIEGEQQLASLSKPAAPDAPAPILMASAETPVGVKPAAGTLPAVFSTVAGKSLALAPATRMLAQHGEKVAPVTQGKLEQKLALPDVPTPAPHKPALAMAAAAKPLGKASGTDRLAKAAGIASPIRSHDASPAHGTPALAAATPRVKAAPAAASGDFLAAATGNDRLRSTGATAIHAKPATSTPALAVAKSAPKPAQKSAGQPQSVADAFGGDWQRQMSNGAKPAKVAASTAKPKPGHKRVAIEDTAGTASQ
jgi:hypothetical protein